MKKKSYQILYQLKKSENISMDDYSSEEYHAIKVFHYVILYLEDM